jgi:hypothetical protein
MNNFLQMFAQSPQAYPFAVCLLAALGTALAALRHTFRTRALYRHLCEPVPKISETKAIKTFNDRYVKLKHSSENCIAVAVLCAFVGIFMFLFLLRVSDEEMSALMVLLAVPMAYALLQFFCFGAYWTDRVDAALAHRPQLGIIKYLDNLPAIRKDSEDGPRLFRGSLDDYLVRFEIGAGDTQIRPTTTVELADARKLSDAQWSASHDERPAPGDAVLIIWRDSKRAWVNVATSRVTKVEDAPAAVTISRPGKAIVTVLNEQFCGGKVAHFCGTPNNKIDRGWIATADRADILLASLDWLDNDQRELCYQLINPGKPLALVVGGA